MQGLSADTILYFIKYIIVYFLLFIIVPRFVFIYDKKDITKSIVANFIKMTFWVVVFGYIIVLLRLYELVTMLATIFLGITYKYYKLRISSGNIGKDVKDIINILFINHVDKIERIERKLLSLYDEKTERFNQIIKNYFGNGWTFLNTIFIVGILAYNGYLNLLGAFSNIAPASNETFTSLLWMKYIGNRVLFADGIYPQGFYIFLETLHRFALMDQVYIVNFAGPVNCIIIAFGMYFFVSRTLNSKIGGIFAALIYALMGNMFINNLPALVSANPQQFAFVFLFPVLYFYYEYINSSRREEFFIVALGAILIGLIHPLAFVFLGVGLITLCLANMIRDVKNTLYKTFEIFIIMLISALMSIIPLGIGLLMGKPYNSEAMQKLYMFLDEVRFPELRLFDYIAIGSMILICISLLFTFKNKKVFVAKLWILIFSLISFSIYYYGVIFTNNSYFIESASALWSLLIPVVISFGVMVIIDTNGLIIKGKAVGYLMCMAAIILALIYVPQAPILTQKIERNTTIEQYLKITKTFRPTQWMIISWQTGYTLALGNGYHTNIIDFISTYNPENEKLVNESVEPSVELKIEDIFIFYEKNIFNDNIDVESEAYKAKLEQNILLSEWLEKYQNNHNNISLYSSDDNLEIWRIHQEPDKEDIKRRVWQGE